MPQERKHPKTYRKFGKVNVISGKDVKVIRDEQWVRINRVTGDCLFDEAGDLMVKKTERFEKTPNTNRK